MWLTIFGSVSFIGVALAVIHFVYSKINHKDVIISSTKKVTDFILDSFASLVQNERPPNFKIRPKCSAGSLLSAIFNVPFCFAKKCTKPRYPRSVPVY